MVNFSIFNELSLPLEKHMAQEKFGVFFDLLEKLRNNGLNKIRMSDDFKNYPILKDITFQQFFGQQSNKEFKDRLRSFISHNIKKIETPIIKTSEINELTKQKNNEYFYNNNLIDGGLAYCDTWKTIAISFESESKWVTDSIDIKKNSIDENSNITTSNIRIKHASNTQHLSSHINFFQHLQNENNLKITKTNFWENRNDNFGEIIKFCPEVENQIKKLDFEVFDKVISILRNLELKQTQLQNYGWSPESQPVRKDSTMRNQREFTINSKKYFFENHIKNLPKGCRIYFLEKDQKIYIGYIGKHLKTKKYN